MILIQRVLRSLKAGITSLKNEWQTIHLARAVARLVGEGQAQKPVFFFNASSRIRSHSLNAAFSLLASWSSGRPGLRLSISFARPG